MHDPERDERTDEAESDRECRQTLWGAAKRSCGLGRDGDHGRHEGGNAFRHHELPLAIVRSRGQCCTTCPTTAMKAKAPIARKRHTAVTRRRTRGSMVSRSVAATSAIGVA